MVAIKEMSMPKYCNDCEFVIDSMGYCERANEQIPNYDFWSETNEKPDFCPLIEIEECKVGKWIGEEEGYYSECSCCGASFLWEDYKCIGDWNHCPNCGAEMRGNEND